jgi:hypothetical protein
MSLFGVAAIFVVCCIATIATYDRYLYPGHRKQIAFIAVLAIVMIVIFDTLIKN